MIPSYRYETVAGDSLKVRVRYTACNSTLEDFTGYNAVCAFRWGTESYELSTQTDTLDLGTDGVISGDVPPTVTQDWPSGHAVTYRLRLIDSLGNVQTILQGDVEVFV